MTRTAPDAEPAAGAAADPGTLRALEFGAIVGMLAELTAFGPSRELAEATLPMADAVHVALLQDQTDEAVRLLDDQAQASIGGARDVRAPIGRARRGGRLTALELLDVAETARAADLFGARLAGWKAPHLAELRDELDPAPALRERIERSVDESGEILDSASAELAAIRKRLRTAQDRVRERLNAMLHSADLAGVIGEAIVTHAQRPLRDPHPGRGQGQGEGDRPRPERLGRDAVRRAAERGRAQQHLDPGHPGCRPRGRADPGRAVARRWRRAPSPCSLRWRRWRAPTCGWRGRGWRPSWTPCGPRPPTTRPSCSARGIRCSGQGAVPIDLRLGERFGYRALVVTGPNTGGKTVSLKTLGLLALMHQAGLRVPAADGARLPVFRRVMADIGDEQSIAQSLSTFSSHLRNVVRFVAAAGPGTLVLLDEVGAGTDPTEGSALAMAVVERLLEQGAWVAATTHYAELKTFAQEHALVSNASVAFDVATLQPTYRLEIGLPGKSQAFAIAERLGLPEPILDDARSRLAAEHVTMEETLAALAAAQEARTAELEEARTDRAAAAAERDLAKSGVGRARRRGGPDPGRCAAGGRRPAGPRRARGGRRAARADAPAQRGRRPACRRANGRRPGHGPAVGRPGAHADCRRRHRAGRTGRRRRGVRGAAGLDCGHS